MFFVVAVLSTTVVASVITIVLAARSGSISNDDVSVDRFAIVQDASDDSESSDD